ncbi:DNA-binding protein [Mycobacterium sp. HUMS_1102779]|uniref:DNA-binding protein n=1 Tax=Mycobacterium sp. HUMS_1102779 TaxID=3383487 RepID=UPI00389A3027
MPKNKPQLRLASIPVAAATADVCTRTIRRYIAQGRIQGYRVGPRLIKVDLNELENALLQPVGGGAA